MLDLTPTGTTPWRDREFLTMKQAGEVVGVSPASLYVFARRGNLVLERFAGRTVVRPRELIDLLERTDTSWAPSNRGRRALEVRRTRVAA